MTNKYFCECCDTEFYYRDSEQQTCEHCNRLIDDDQVVHIMECNKMSMYWTVKYGESDQENKYICPCGIISESEDYNSETGTIICQVCGKESPDVENIIIEAGND